MPEPPLEPPGLTVRQKLNGLARETVAEQTIRVNLGLNIEGISVSQVVALNPDKTWEWVDE